MMSVLFLGCCVLFALAYRFYGRFLEKRLDVSSALPTPAHTLHDNMDYVPTRTGVLFGHHFSSIAGAGPIVGPIIAGLAFGWLPALLWIVLGSIFVGGVHDYTSLVASLRHQGRSVGQMCKDLLSPFAYYLFLTFIWLTMVYIQIVFLDLTASTFAPAIPAALEGTEEAALLTRQGGAVASASILYILLALGYGSATVHLKVPEWIGTLVFVPLVFIGLWAGRLFPLAGDQIPIFLGSAKNTWALVLLVYCFVASILPVWLLLQPRDYLSSFLLYACLIGGGIALLVSGWTDHANVEYEAFVTWRDPKLQFLFPALFVTVACGAVSGFHSLVSSGTTAKQLDNESHARPVAYGGMLVEGVLALIALATVMMLADKPSNSTPVAIFASGLGKLLSIFRLDPETATTFGFLAVSTFLLTTLDTCTRLSRFVFEELFNLRGPWARVVGTLASLAIPAVVVFRQVAGPGGVRMPAWQAIWPAFGVTNQLLAALAMLVVFAWLRREGKRSLYVLLPLAFMMVTTLTAAAQLVRANLFGGGSILVGALSLVLAVLALVLVANTGWKMLRRRAA
ncbi:MAG: Carbon starvation protein A [Verrucomicrobia bacterium ADurb.Bin345]|nr:MAG: Carbon starvation protein A [Verrucomicrobia bacterium ADurb.Bin345]